MKTTIIMKTFFLYVNFICAPRIPKDIFITHGTLNVFGFYFTTCFLNGIARFISFLLRSPFVGKCKTHLPVFSRSLPLSVFSCIFFDRISRHNVFLLLFFHQASNMFSLWLNCMPSLPPPPSNIHLTSHFNLIASHFNCAITLHANEVDESGKKRTHRHKIRSNFRHFRHWNDSPFNFHFEITKCHFNFFVLYSPFSVLFLLQTEKNQINENHISLSQRVFRFFFYFLSHRFCVSNR